MHSRDMEYIVGLLKNGKDAEAILSVRRKLNMAFLARTTDLSGKLPVLAFGSTFKKNGDGIQLRRYNGYVLLEVNGLESQGAALPAAVGQHYIVERTVPVAGVPDECGSGRLLQSGCGGDLDRATFADAGRG